MLELITFELASMFVTTHRKTVVARTLKIMKRIPCFTISSAYCRSSSGLTKSGSGHELDICLLYNLMHALTAEVVRICDLTKSHPLATHLKNFRISIMIRRRPWLQRAPRPTGKIFKNLNFLCSNLVLLAALPDVTYPSPEVHFRPINNLNVNGRDPRVTGTFRELTEGSYIKLKSGVVIHVQKYRTFASRVREWLG